MLAEAALGAPPSPFMAMISLWIEEKPDVALGQASHLRAFPPISQELQSSSFPQLQGNQDWDGKIRAHGNQNSISEVVERVYWCQVRSGKRMFVLNFSLITLTVSTLKSREVNFLVYASDDMEKDIPPPVLEYHL